MAKGNNKSSPSPWNLNNTISKVKKEVVTMENKMKSMEEKVDSLESEVIVSEIVSSKLEKEINRLNQYHRCSNIILKMCFYQRKKTIKMLTIEIISKDLNLPNVIPDVDKQYHIREVKESNGKKSQGIMVKFKSHSTRYLVYKERKKIKKKLTKR